MRPIFIYLTILLMLLGLTLTPVSVGAIATVSGEKMITPSPKTKLVLKKKLTDGQKKRFMEMKEKLMAELKVLKDQVATYDAAIFDIKMKIEARIKAGITDNADFKAKLFALMKAKSQAKKDINSLMAKLAYIESKLK